MLPIIASLAFCIFLTLAYWVLSKRTLADISAPELLIVAAHSDDCVIMGAEMAWGILRDGGRVRIAYLTCSGANPEEEISQVRMAEAEAAWRDLNEGDVELVGTQLPQSPVEGPQAYSEADLERFEGLLVTHMTEMAEGAVVLLTAPFESHIDHNNARRAGIEAIAKANRPDLRVFETPEYNSLLSMRHDPVAVVLRALSELPLLGRFLPKRSASPAFLGGKVGACLEENAERTAMKGEMLDAFISQDPKLLRGYFMRPSKYRRLQQTSDPFAVRLMGKTADLSVIVYLGAISLAILFAVYSLAKLSLVGAVVAAVLGSGLGAFAFRKKRTVPGLLGGALVLGALLGGVV